MHKSDIWNEKSVMHSWKRVVELMDSGILRIDAERLKEIRIKSGQVEFVWALSICWPKLEEEDVFLLLFYTWPHPFTKKKNVQ